MLNYVVMTKNRYFWLWKIFFILSKKFAGMPIANSRRKIVIYNSAEKLVLSSYTFSRDVINRALHNLPLPLYRWEDKTVVQ